MDAIRQRYKKNLFFASITDWLAGIVSSIAVAGSIVKGFSVLSQKKKDKQQRKKEDDDKREAEKLLLSKLPKFMESMELVAQQGTAVAQSVSRISQVVTRLEENQFEVKTLRRIQDDEEDKMIYRCTAEGRCYEVSKTLCEAFGLSEAEMLANDGTGWISAIENPSRAWLNWINSVNSNFMYEDSYYIINRTTKPHTRKLYKTKTWPIPGVDGHIRSYFGIVKEHDPDEFN